MIQLVSSKTLQRLPTYLSYLKSLPDEGSINISAKTIADILGLGEIQVRKDLAAISSGGKPKIGYITKDLILNLEAFLGYNDVNDAIIIGAGKLGKALLLYNGFKDYGMNIVAAFDIDDSVIDTEESGKPILSLNKVKDLCHRMNIRIGIITVPAEFAQTVCDVLVDSGILAIWNFAPVHLNVPKNILIQNENLAASLAVLSKNLIENLNKTSKER